jgi:very-short-patch-repair endonuclease
MNSRNPKSPSPSGRGVGERVSQLDHAKYLRSNQTDAEQRLWYHLRAHRFMNLKFRRQALIGPFIVDFVCMEYKLIVEADGSQHVGDHDARRNEWLKKQGFTVLHFWNNDILQQTDVVLENIHQEIIALSPSPHPLSLRERGVTSTYE